MIVIECKVFTQDVCIMSFEPKTYDAAMKQIKWFNAQGSTVHVEYVLIDNNTVLHAQVYA